MTLAPTSDMVPLGVNKYLLPHERQVITVRSHPAVLMGPVGAAVGGFIAAIVLSIVANFSGTALLIMWLVWVLLVLYALLKILIWYVSYFVVTSYRMLVVKGVFTRDIVMVPTSIGLNLRFRRTTLGRLLGYGQFTMAPKGQDPALRKVNYLPYPEQLYLEVVGLMLNMPEIEEGWSVEDPAGEINPQQTRGDEQE
jgi:hypothetical protein